MNTVEKRREAWRQTPERLVENVDGAIELVRSAGIVTHFPASTEFANVYSAHMGDPEAKTDAKWDSPSGRVYTWRWEMGAREAGFYSFVVRKRPTWVHWDLLPAVLRLRAERRAPDELFQLGELSADAYRLVSVLEDAGGVLSTGELRARAGFPTGKDQRAAYGKAIAELDTKLMLSKTFSSGEDEMRHQLVFAVHREFLLRADDLSEEAAWDSFLRAYLPQAAFVAPGVLARHLGVDPTGLLAALQRLEGQGEVRQERIEGYKEICYMTLAAYQHTSRG